MTDTRITVDVSTEALLQRAREQQSQSRQAVIQKEETKRQAAQQRAAAKKAGREQVPGQSTMKGRSRRGGMGYRRPEVAAGFVQQTQMATAYLLQTDTYFDGVGASPERLTFQIWSGDQSKYVTWTALTYPLGDQVFGRAFQTFPINKSSMLVIGAYPEIVIVSPGVVRRSFVNAVPPGCFFVSRTSVRQLQIPNGLTQKMDNLLIEEDGNTYPNYEKRHLGLKADFPTIAEGYEQGWVPSFPSVDYAMGTPAAMRKMLGLTEDKPPGYYKFAFSDANARYNVTKHQTKEYAGGKLMPLIKPFVRLTGGKNRDFYTYTDASPEGGFTEQVPTTSCMAISWDWGNPALCRRLLLQLGFTPADLVP